MERYEKKIVLFIILFMVISTVSSFLCIYNFITLKLYSYILYFFGFFAFVLILYGIINKYYLIKKYDYIIILLIIFGIISTVNAIIPSVSLYGKGVRCEGLISIICYYLLFLLSRNVRNKKNINIIINVFLSLGTLNIIYGLLQVFPYYDKIFDIKSPWIYSAGSFGNSNFYGTYMLMQLSLSIGLFLSNKKYLLFVILYSLALVLSGSMSVFVGFCFIILCLLCYFIYKKKLTKYLSKILLVVVTFILFVLFIPKITESSVIDDIVEMKNELNEGLNSGMKAEYGSNRIYIWTNTIKVLPKYLLTGTGIDNFQFAFRPILRTLDHNLIVDKAHNEYLQKIFTEGIFSFITYMCLLLFIFIDGIKKISSDTYLTLMLLFISYCIQAFFNISVIRVAPFFFIFSGFLVSKKECNKS